MIEEDRLIGSSVVSLIRNAIQPRDRPLLILVAARAELEAGEGCGLLGVCPGRLQVDALEGTLMLDHHL